LKKIKPLTKKQKEQEIESLHKLAENYRKRPRSRKREIVPFELDIGNFCCATLHREFKIGNYTLKIQYIVGKYYVWLHESNGTDKNYCPFCHKHIDDFFYIKQY